MCIVLETLKEKYVFTAIVTQMPLLSFLKKAKIAKIKQKLKISAFYLLLKLLSNCYKCKLKRVYCDRKFSRLSALKIKNLDRGD